jgi:hypothetical protein
MERSPGVRCWDVILNVRKCKWQKFRCAKAIHQLALWLGQGRVIAGEPVLRGEGNIEVACVFQDFGGLGKIGGDASGFEATLRT